ncbi:MAG: Gfo/Idh/MocA family oxidoreductase [Fimbriimonadaceae bacterium]|nr:Gfo/Idh/MocA family oxidoreductase [Fimbriimonadaceae bacterium]
MSKPLTGVIIGAGHRSLLYASHALRHPDELTIVAVADPDPVRRQVAAEKYGLAPEQCYETAEQLAARPRFADVAINGTMDRQHVPTSLPLLEAGYDILLEKPISPTRDELLTLLAKVRETGRTLCIGHVLRYAPFYVAVKERLAAGEIGQLLSVHTHEMVSYHHMATAFVRGKWRRQDTSAPILLAKCCHDLDLLAWFCSGNAPQRVASFGSLSFFRPEAAPPGAGTRCLTDCPIEPTCDYSAHKHFIEMGLWRAYAWEPIEYLGDPTLEQKLESLRTDNPYGRCVWHCDNDVVDHQSVLVEFADGVTATHDLATGTSRPCRHVHLRGTHGELEGTMEDGRFVVRHHDVRKGSEYREELVDLSVSRDMHGGGDYRLVADFVRVVRGETPSLSSTNIMDSVNGHLIAYAADDALQTRRVVELATV